MSACAQYFQTTSDVYETLVMGTDIEALDSADNTLLQLKEQQDNIGRSLIFSIKSLDKFVSN